jgi:S-adenosyl-L-methionine hydrolase (adenosine-forming)
MLITLTTDFGHQDPFAGIMKGVIAGINPRAQVIDLSHGIPPQDVMAGALSLRHAVSYFPPATIHVAVIDPGVGGARRAILIESAGNYFIGPDNGVLSLAVSGAKPDHVVELSNPEYRLKSLGTTFHGRDIFAPVAAHLSLGVPAAAFGASLSSFVELRLPEIRREGNRWESEVIYIDRYGNLFTNLSEGDLTGMPSRDVHIAVGSTTIAEIGQSYGSVSPGRLVAVWNSWGLLEIAVYMGNAQQTCNARIGDRIIVTAV